MSDLDDLAAARRSPQSPSAQAMGSERIWTVHDQGRQFGPHTEIELATMLGTGTISQTALVWRDGSPRWIPITNIVPAKVSPPHIPQQSTTAAPVIVNIHNVNSVRPASPLAFFENRTNGFGVASLVLGIIAVVTVCIPFITIPLAAIGLVLGLVGIFHGRSQNRPIGLSIAGSILCGVVFLFTVIVLIGVLNSMSATPRQHPFPRRPSNGNPF